MQAAAQKKSAVKVAQHIAMHAPLNLLNSIDLEVFWQVRMIIARQLLVLPKRRDFANDGNNSSKATNVP
jgi:hypothetical protein